MHQYPGPSGSQVSVPIGQAVPKTGSHSNKGSGTGSGHDRQPSVQLKIQAAGGPPVQIQVSL